jgi:hypothetical protein
MSNIGLTDPVSEAELTNDILDAFVAVGATQLLTLPLATALAEAIIKSMTTRALVTVTISPPSAVIT